MTPSVTFESFMIAPCGMNCGACIAHLRDKNKCHGCRVSYAGKPKTRQYCIVKNCIYLTNSTSGFCYECEKFPCKRIKQLDRRYQTKYRTSLIQNLEMINEKGINAFLENEIVRWTCPGCGSTLSCHRNNCLVCNFDLSEARKG
jgi:hypothetical protein